MKISEIYQLEPQSTTFELSDFLAHTDFNHLAYSNLLNQEIETKVIWRQDFDYRRYWQLASVWIDDKPFGIIQNAGRSGLDYLKAFWTDSDLYIKAIRYIQSIEPLDNLPTITNLDFESISLTKFYDFSYGEEYYKY